MSYAYLGYVTSTSGQLADVWVSYYFWQAYTGGTGITWIGPVPSAGCDFNIAKADDKVGNIDMTKGAGLYDFTPTYGNYFGLPDDNGAILPAKYMRTKEGIERFLVTDINNAAGSAKAQSDIPTMFDAWGNNQSYQGSANGVADSGIARFNHIPGGSNVLYMDGHVEFVKYNAKWMLKNGPSFPGSSLSWYMGGAAGNG